VVALIYRIHKRIGVGIGAVLVMWVMTGMLIPGDERPTRRHDLAGLARAKVPPAVAITVAQARALAEAEYPEGKIRSVEQIHRRDRGSQFGLFPVWRIQYDDEGGAWVQVATREARVVRNTRWDRAKTTMRGLHTFATLRILRIPGDGIYALLVSPSLIALAGIFTGYYLSPPKSWRPGGR